MFLNVGNSERIEDPSADQLRHFLRFMPPGAPFVILSLNDDLFMQAAPAGDTYRIEFRDGNRQYFTQASFDQAAQLLESFRAGDQSFELAAPWRRLSIWNDPYHPAVLITLVLLSGLAVLISIWFAIR